eukprot:2752440-Amphidinium_carterae.1
MYVLAQNADMWCSRCCARCRTYTCANCFRSVSQTLCWPRYASLQAAKSESWVLAKARLARFLHKFADPNFRLEKLYVLSFAALSCIPLAVRVVCGQITQGVAS